MVILTFLVFDLKRNKDEHYLPKVVEGVIDLSDWNFESDGIVSLDGMWSFYWKQLLLPEEIFDQLELALTLALKHEITVLQLKIVNEKKYATDYITRYNSMSNAESNMFSRIDDANILSYLGEVSKIVRS